MELSASSERLSADGKDRSCMALEKGWSRKASVVTERQQVVRFEKPVFASVPVYVLASQTGEGSRFDKIIQAQKFLK